MITKLAKLKLTKLAKFSTWASGLPYLSHCTPLHGILYFLPITNYFLSFMLYLFTLRDLCHQYKDCGENFAKVFKVFGWAVRKVLISKTSKHHFYHFESTSFP